VVKTKPQVIRVVLDTNVLVSALLFGGKLNRLVVKWKTGDVVPVFSRATFDEFRRVLAYPRFALSESEIRISGHHQRNNDKNLTFPVIMYIRYVYTFYERKMKRS